MPNITAERLTGPDMRLADHLRSLGDESARHELLTWVCVSHERDHGEDGHGSRVSGLAREVVRALGVPSRAADLIAAAAELHDIGKLGVPSWLLGKCERLTEPEAQIVRTHTTFGAEILSGAGDSPVFGVAAAVALTHHERWDGSGYHGVRGRGIPLASRIVAVCDVYDALVNSRCYKGAWPADDAADHLVRAAGVRFDAAVVGAFLDVLGVDATV